MDKYKVTTLRKDERFKLGPRTKVLNLREISIHPLGKSLVLDLDHDLWKGFAVVSICIPSLIASLSNEQLRIVFSQMPTFLPAGTKHE